MNKLYPYFTFELLFQIETLLDAGVLPDLDVEGGRVSELVGRARAEVVELAELASAPISASKVD